MIITICFILFFFLSLHFASIHHSSLSHLVQNLRSSSACWGQEQCPKGNCFDGYSFWENKRQIGVCQETSEMWTVLVSKILRKEWVKVSSGVTKIFFLFFLQEVRKVGWLTEPDVLSIIAINAVLALMCLLMVLVLSHCTANSKSSKKTSFSSLLFLWGKTSSLGKLWSFILS